MPGLEERVSELEVKVAELEGIVVVLENVIGGHSKLISRVADEILVTVPAGTCPPLRALLKRLQDVLK